MTKKDFAALARADWLRAVAGSGLAATAMLEHEQQDCKYDIDLAIDCMPSVSKAALLALLPAIFARHKMGPIACGIVRRHIVKSQHALWAAETARWSLS